ncbi:ly6/PLAUR domain-containing protein 2-like [Pseudorasbora parva]|uniref:ly6/PLAUR domain-containing protein 2-like n=1 Tax=Pseudorasbora parva TaxID=51549 RepID=UPI00351DCF1D
MDLQVSVFLLFVLFTAGHTLDCYECVSSTGSCENQTVKTCPSGFPQCLISTSVVQAGDITHTAKSQSCAAFCQSGSINVNTAKTSTSCCNTSLCNANVTGCVAVRTHYGAPELLPNGKTCYTCDGQSCSKILNCLGTEDRCITVAETSGNQTTGIKGCVSKAVCDVLEFPICCEGNLCNGAQSVTQSFLFLCCSLLSYFLLH